MRIRVAEETGRSPFDPSVVREAKRRVAEQIDVDVERLIGDPLPVVLAAIPSIRGEGRFGDRRVFIAALWDRVREEIRMSLPEFKRWLIDQHRARRLVLSRADLVAAMPHDMVVRSESETEGAYRGATFHFVIDPSV